jgi:hypothetical protein
MSNPFGLGTDSIAKHLPPPDAGEELCTLIEQVISGDAEAVSLPWARLSRLTQALLPGTVTVLCGAPGASKTFAVLQLLHNIYRRGIGVAYFALEGPRQDYALRLLAQLSSCSEMTDREWIKANPTRARVIQAEHREAVADFGSMVYTSPNDPVDFDALLGWIRERCAEGARVLCIDPITAASPEREPWIADQAFLTEARKLIAPAGASLVCVTHPKKGTNAAVGLDTLAGGAAWSRFSDCVLWLERPDEPEEVRVAQDFGGVAVQAANRLVHIPKARNARGAGLTLAFNFSPDSLTLKELGIVRRGD